MVFVSRIVLCEHSQAEHEGPLTQEEVVHEEVVVEGPKVAVEEDPVQAGEVKVIGEDYGEQLVGKAVIKVKEYDALRMDEILEIPKVHGIGHQLQREETDKKSQEERKMPLIPEKVIPVPRGTEVENPKTQNGVCQRRQPAEDIENENVGYDTVEDGPDDTVLFGSRFCFRRARCIDVFTLWINTFFHVHSDLAFVFD